MWRAEKKQWAGVETNIYRNTDGPFDYLFLHGFLENAQMLKPVLSSLNSEINFCAPDLPGHGKSKMIDGDSEISTLVEWLVPMLEENGRPVFIFGHSLGGYLALELAQKFPEYVGGLFLAHSTATADSEVRKESREQGKRVLEMDKERYLKTAIDSLFIDSLKDVLEDEMGLMVSDALEMEEANVAWYLDAMKTRNSNVQSVADRLFPLIYFSGENDPILPTSVYREEVAITQPEKSFRTASAGHMSHLEAPHELVSAINWTIANFGRHN